MIQFTLIERLVAIVFRGWYPFLRKNDPRIGTTSLVQSRGGAEYTPIFHANWQRYIIVRCDSGLMPAATCYPVRRPRVWWTFGMMWIYTRSVVAPGDCVRFGVGREPAEFGFVSGAYQICRAFAIAEYSIGKDGQMFGRNGDGREQKFETEPRYSFHV